MNTATGALSVLRRIGIVIAIAIVFVFGLATTVYLSLRSPEVKVPDVIGKDRFEAERVLDAAGLNFRVRATRPSSQVNPDTVLFQLPRGGEVVKAGQTVAMDISRVAKEGESSLAVPEKSPEETPSNQNTNESLAANENKPKRNKNTNKNENDNDNANANTNRATANKNANLGNTNRSTNVNSGRPPANDNANANRTVPNVNRSTNQNANVRPATVKPSPAVRPKPENP